VSKNLKSLEKLLIRGFYENNKGGDTIVKEEFILDKFCKKRRNDV